MNNDDVIVSVNYTIEMQFPVLGATELNASKSAKAKTFGEILFGVTTESNNDYYYGSTSTVTEVAPYVSRPAMAKILFDKAKIKFVYSNQSINN